MTNNNVPQNPHTESNQGLSITGHVESPLLSSEWTANNDPREIVVIHDANTTEGSQDNPIMVDSIPEQTTSVTPKTRNSRPRRNVGPPQFYGNRRFIDVVQEKDDLGAPTTVFSQAPEFHSSTFAVNSPSDLLTPLAEAPPRQILVAETTLSWSSRNSLPTVRLETSTTKTHLHENSSDSNVTYPTSKDPSLEMDNYSEISSTIDSEVRAKLDEFEDQFL